MLSGVCVQHLALNNLWLESREQVDDLVKAVNHSNFTCLQSLTVRIGSGPFFRAPSPSYGRDVLLKALQEASHNQSIHLDYIIHGIGP